MDKFCTYCKQCFDIDSDHWYIQKRKDRRVSNKPGTYLRCNQQNRNNAKEWRSKNPILMRFRSHKDYDRKQGFKNDITLEWYIQIIQEECFYCEHKPAGGIDRKNSNVGHEKLNCVPCCSKCNIILGSIPFEAKLELKSGLTIIKQKQLLVNWKLPCECVGNKIYETKQPTE